MDARITAIFRHPVKGFTPEPLDHVDLAPGEDFPNDRIYAVEHGPSGFDPAAPAFIPKQKFTVLASLPRVAAARTRYDEATTDFHATAPGLPAFQGRLAEAAGRDAFAAWVSALLGDDLRAPLKVIRSPGAWRFTDNPKGQVSILNLASIRDLEARTGQSINPLRFRANLHVEGWPPWAETRWRGCSLSLGGATATVFKSIVRCAAINVDVMTAERNMDLTRDLFDHYGHMFCGIYAHMDTAGRLAPGDLVSTPDPEFPKDPE